MTPVVIYRSNLQKIVSHATLRAYNALYLSEKTGYDKDGFTGDLLLQEAGRSLQPFQQ